jgi:hypothetical protein
MYYYDHYILYILVRISIFPFLSICDIVVVNVHTKEIIAFDAFQEAKQLVSLF